ncbi:MAG TPA: D-alanyl-D-alanine carboxypeptidase family protein, partial [Dongiaceae bacterium]|nr:D-alanyl-D-alanine carboxypeptidase family protein [Dongiaceae bacterium]
MAVEQRRLRGGKGSPFSAAVLLLAVFLLSLTAAPLVAHARPVSSSILVDASTGEVLASSNADAVTYPASLTKMMTLYQLFDTLKRGQIKLTDTIVFSAHAAAQDATNLAVSAGDTISVETAIRAIVVRSANDAATAIGEKLGGTEWAFAKRMNQTARALGMTNTVFQNANGLPIAGQHTTARDMAILGVALIRDFPEYYHYFSVESFTYHGVQYGGHNHVLDKFDGADGLKTGYIRASGFNVVSSAVRNGRRLLGVVMGGQSPYLRDKQMVAMLTKGFGSSVGTGTQLALNGSVKTTPTPAAPAALAVAEAAQPAPAAIAPAAPVTPPPSVAAAPAMVTTARDMAILGVALIRDFPEYYHYFSVESFTYHGVQYGGHNHVLDKFDGADGLKTGYIRASGFNVVSSAVRNGRRLLGVVMGGQSPYLRDKQMVAMLTKGFGSSVGTGTQLAL